MSPSHTIGLCIDCNNTLRICLYVLCPANNIKKYPQSHYIPNFTSLSFYIENLLFLSSKRIQRYMGLTVHMHAQWKKRAIKILWVLPFFVYTHCIFVFVDSFAHIWCTAIRAYQHPLMYTCVSVCVFFHREHTKNSNKIETSTLDEYVFCQSLFIRHSTNITKQTHQIVQKGLKTTTIQ